MRSHVSADFFSTVVSSVPPGENVSLVTSWKDLITDSYEMLTHVKSHKGFLHMCRLNVDKLESRSHMVLINF